MRISEFRGAIVAPSPLSPLAPTPRPFFWIGKAITVIVVGVSVMAIIVRVSVADWVGSSIVIFVLVESVVTLVRVWPVLQHVLVISRPLYLLLPSTYKPGLT